MEVHILPHNIKIQVDKGKRLYQVLEDNGIIYEGCCKGMGTCGKCSIQITKGCNEPSKKDIEAFTKEELGKGIRLACHVNVMNDMVILYKNNRATTNNKNNKERNIATDKSVIGEYGKEINPTTLLEENNNKREYKYGNRYGVAIDMGTTNVVATLWNIENKKNLGTYSMENPQRSYGLDVISRITYGIGKEINEENLHRTLLSACNVLVESMCSIYHIERKCIEQIVYVGNTTMVYSLIKRPLSSLSKVPFGKVDYSKSIWNERGEHISLPLIRGHVGSDALGCIISTSIHKRFGKYLIIDIGTNGELLLSVNGHITVCSTAAGPAFEAANISCGMVAKEGAITQLDIIDGGLKLHYIGREQYIPPAGICGSGLVDIVAKLLLHQWMDDTGRLLYEHGENNQVVLYNENDTTISLKQKDIREFQLGKAAVATGIQLLLKEKNMNMEELDEIYIAGALGTHIGTENLFVTGILPRVSEHKVKFIGNAALDGASKFLLGEYTLSEVEDISNKVEYIELANEGEFEEKFIKNINFIQTI